MRSAEVSVTVGMAKEQVRKTETEGGKARKHELKVEDDVVRMSIN